MKRYQWLLGAAFIVACAAPVDGGTDGETSKDGKADQLGEVETCSFDEPWLFDTTADLEPFVTGRTEYTERDADELPNIDRQQIVDAFLQDRNVIDSVQGAFDLADEGLIEVIELRLDDGSELDWVRYFGGDNEVGVIYTANTLTAQAVVSDGDFMSCDADEPSLVVECSFGSWARESTEDIDSIPGSELLITVDSDPTSLQLEQIIAAGIQTQQITGEESIEDVFNAVDLGEYIYSQIEVDGDVFDWVQFFAGDTEVGVIFEVDTTVIVAEIGDGDISGCEKPVVDEPDTGGEFTCSFEDEWQFADTGELLDHVSNVPQDVVDRDNINEQEIITQQQIFQAGVHLQMLDDTSEFVDIWEASDDEEYLLRTFEAESGWVTWVKFFAGDTQIGVIFSEGTTDIVAEISDGDILACSPN